MKLVIVVAPFNALAFVCFPQPCDYIIYYQITATERIINRIEISTNYKKYGTVAGGGYIWHTTGSGKTLTSFKTARTASQLPFIDKVLFVVDRKDLD